MVPWTFSHYDSVMLFTIDTNKYKKEKIESCKTPNSGIVVNFCSMLANIAIKKGVNICTHVIFITGRLCSLNTPTSLLTIRIFLQRIVSDVSSKHLYKV